MDDGPHPQVVAHAGEFSAGGFNWAFTWYVHASQAFASKESVMSSEPKGQPEHQNTIELDRQAWNLPSPQPQPVGPMRDVWPVRPAPMRGVEDSLLEDPAAA